MRRASVSVVVFRCRIFLDVPFFPDFFAIVWVFVFPFSIVVPVRHCLLTPLLFAISLRVFPPHKRDIHTFAVGKLRYLVGGAKRMTKLPDFKQLNDRLINEPSDEPMLVIKTNLDPERITDENPYAKGKTNVIRTFASFFEGGKP